MIGPRPHWSRPDHLATPHLPITIGSRHHRPHPPSGHTQIPRPPSGHAPPALSKSFNSVLSPRHLLFFGAWGPLRYSESLLATLTSGSCHAMPALPFVPGTAVLCGRSLSGAGRKGAVHWGTLCLFGEPSVCPGVSVPVQPHPSALSMGSSWHWLVHCLVCGSLSAGGTFSQRLVGSFRPTTEDQASWTALGDSAPAPSIQVFPLPPVQVLPPPLYSCSLSNLCQCSCSPPVQMSPTPQL